MSFVERTANKPLYVLGIDVGGQSIEAQIFKVVDGKISHKYAITAHVTTKLGVAEHAVQIADLINGANKYAHAFDGVLVGVGIGSPGRFDAEGRIKAGSNPFMGKTKNEFDNVNLKEKYQEALKPFQLDKLPLYVCNDGNAMLAGILETIGRGRVGNLVDQNGKIVDEYGLYNKSVASLGIGTGVGNAIVSIDDNGKHKFVTDGHASKLRVKVDDADWEMLVDSEKRLKKIRPEDSLLLFREDKTARAEDLFRAPVINAIAGVDGRDIELNNPKHKAAVDFAGKYMARTIALIKNGDSIDVVPENGWSADDKRKAAKTSVYLISGGMGGSPVVGKAIIEAAKNELENLGINDIKIVQIPEEKFDSKANAARSAAMLVPEAVYRQQPRQV